MRAWPLRDGRLMESNPNPLNARDIGGVNRLALEAPASVPSTRASVSACVGPSLRASPRVSFPATMSADAGVATLPFAPTRVLDNAESSQRPFVLVP